MRILSHRVHKFIAKGAALSLLLATAVSLPAQTPSTGGQPAGGAHKTPAQTTKTTSLKSAPVSTINVAFPRTYNTPKGGRVILYSPQVSEWPEQKHMVAYSAVSYLASGAQKSVLGTIRLEADTSVSLEEHLVLLSPLKISESSFGGLPREQVAEIVAEITNAIPKEERVFSLERALAFVDSGQITPPDHPKDTAGLNVAPPTIFFSKKPALIVNFDGDPIWSPIKENDLKFAVNTNWDLFQYQPQNCYYLRHDDTWLKATDIKGPWEPAGKLPTSFNKLPADDNFKDVLANIPGRALAATQVPQVLVSLQPAELILLSGEPMYQPVTGTGLLWVSNTESDLFREGQSGPFFYLVTGRWWRAYDLAGPWTFATPNLPADFKKISLEHPRSRVLASVPGTQQAAEAIVLASIPQTARIKKSELQAPAVLYQGQPQFQAIDTTVERAVNTDKDVLRIRGAYYLCYDGVWFMSNGATGPWAVASSVPPEIYGIPSSSPAHNLTYVTTKQDEDPDWVDVAITSGYTGMMVGWGCAMWGTGWYYPPYYWYGGYYPIYYPYFHTYGAAAWYNPANGAFGVAGGIYGPYGGVTYGARYNPSTGTYARGGRAYGPYGSRGYAQAYNPRTGTYGQTRSGSNVYGNWRSSYVQRGDDWVSTKKYTDRATGDTTRVTRTDEGGMIRHKGDDGSGFVGKHGDDTYAGKDGNVYRKDENGNWSKWENGGWNQVERPESPSQLPSDSKDIKDREKASSKSKERSKVDSSTFDKLEKDSSARKSGKERTEKYSNSKSSRTPSSSRSMGSYGGMRGGGGGFRGGGGRR
jgi:hypothetical protein